MPGKNKVIVSTSSTKYRVSAAERRAAWLAEIANKQAELKQEAADRRTKLSHGTRKGLRDGSGEPTG